MSRPPSKIVGKWWVVIDPSGSPMWATCKRSRNASIQEFKGIAFEWEPGDYSISKKWELGKYACAPLRISHFHTYRNRREQEVVMEAKPVTREEFAAALIKMVDDAQPKAVEVSDAQPNVD